MSHINSKCKPYGVFFPSSFTHGFLLLSKCWFEFKPCSAPEYIFGVGNCVFGGFCWETRAWCHYLHYTKICSLPQISCVTSDESLNPFYFFFPCLGSSAWKWECCKASLKYCKADPWAVLKGLILGGALQAQNNAYVWELGTRSVGGETSLVVKWFAHTRIIGLWQDRDWDQRIFA